MSLRRFTAFQWVLTGLLLAVCSAAVIVAISLDDVPLALIFAGVTLFWAIPVGQKSLAKRPAPRARSDAEATTLRPGRSVDVCAAVMMSVGWATAWAWAVLGVLDVVRFPIGEGGRFAYVIPFGGFGVFCATYLGMMVKNRGTAYLRLTPTDFVFAEGFYTGRGRWSDVAAVNDDVPVYDSGFWTFKTKKAQPYARCAVSITKLDGTMAAVPNGALYAPDGDALREWVHFYWQHPEYRVELSDDRALARLKAWEPAA
jgi:hypothetical protein